MDERLAEKHKGGESEVKAEEERRAEVMLPSYEEAEVGEHTKGGGEHALCWQCDSNGAHPHGLLLKVLLLSVHT